MSKKENISITSEAKRVENEKTKEQKAAAEALEKKMAEAEKAAKAEQKKEEKEEAAAKKSAESTSKSSKSSSKNDSLLDGDAGKLLEAGLTAAGGLAISGSKQKGFFKGLVVGVLVGAIITCIAGFALKDNLFGTVETTKDSADALIAEHFYGYTAADFQDAILGKASEHQELIVMEQPLAIPTTITKAGLGGLNVFSKVKSVTYYGTGVYTVDMSNIDKDHISVNEDDKKVSITIPHTILQYVNYDIEKTEFEDTEKGLLSFGDITLTQEQQQELEKSINDAMREELNRDDLFQQADDYGKMKVWEIFQPVVSAVSPAYTVEIVME